LHRRQKMDLPPRRKLDARRQLIRQFNRTTYYAAFISILVVAGSTGSIDKSAVTVSAFIIEPNTATFDRRTSTRSSRSPSNHLPPARLHLSSLGREPEENETKPKIKPWITFKLPPPPEDQLSLSGDVTFIFVYSFLDHMASTLYDSTLSSPTISSAVSALAAIESSAAASLDYTGYDSPIDSLPVWFDALNSAPFGIVPLSAALPIEQRIAYAPAFGSAGLAAVLLTSTWLVCGYFTGAFRFENTLECSTRRAIGNTAKTCFVTSIVMVGLALGSDHFVGCVDCLHKSVGLTKADTAYIFDSLSVLLLWRFVTSSILGYGGSSDD